MKLFGCLHVTNGTVVLLKGFGVVIPMNGHGEGISDKHAEEHSPNFFWFVRIHEMCEFELMRMELKCLESTDLISISSILEFTSELPKVFF